MTTAIALIQKGFEIEIFESAPAFKKAGSGINLAINTMQVYNQLGIADEIYTHANHTTSMNARKKDFSFLTQTRLDKFEKEYGVKTVAIHRSALHDILLNNIGKTKIHLNKKLKSLEQKANKVYLNFEDGSTFESDIVIGADGIHSAVRKSLFTDTQLRDAAQVCWRGISDAQIAKQHLKELNEVWGRGNRFGFVHIQKDKVYWFALKSKKDFTRKNEDLLEIFNDYHPTVLKIIKETPKEAIIFNEIWDLKPIDTWHKGNVCLVGDAAHATTPNLGQGAVQAIESAMALSICLKDEEDIQKAFENYQGIRKKKANQVVKISWFIGKIAQSNSRIICGLRNVLSKITPASIAEKQSKKLFDLIY